MSSRRQSDSIQFVFGPMSLIPKRILVVAHDTLLRATRVNLLERAGYSVASVVTDDDAMKLLETERFDLILLGRKSEIPKTGLDQRLRERHPDLLTLKIQPGGDVVSLYPSRTTDALPQHVLSALKEMLQPKRRNDDDL
jgi:CheY-like chemotaxis protein